MALPLSVGSQESFHVLLRLFNNGIRTFDLIKDRINNIFSNIFSCKAYIDENQRSLRHGEHFPSLLDDINVGGGNKSLINNLHWFSQWKICCHIKVFREASPSRLNVFNAMLKSSLERLKTLRENVSLSYLIRCTRCISVCDYGAHVETMKNLSLGGKAGIAIWIRNKMIQDGVIPDVYTHNYILNGLCESSDLENADWLVREMLEIGPTPNCITYNTYLKGYCHANNIDKVLDILSLMLENHVKPDPVTFVILVNALCQNGFLENAWNISANLLDDDCLQETSYLTITTILLEGCFRNGDMVRAIRLWDVMFQNTQVDVFAYNVVVEGVCVGGDLKLAFEYTCDMFKRGLNPNVFTYRSLINRLCRERDIDEACYIFCVMSRMGVDPDEETFKSIIRGLCNYGDVNRAYMFLLLMIEKSMVPIALLWNLVIYGFVRFGDLSSAFFVKDMMIAFGILPNLYTYNALFHAYVKVAMAKGRNFYGILFLKREMLSRGLCLNEFSYIALIGGACRLGLIDLADEYNDEMIRIGYSPNMTIYIQLLKCYCMYGKIERAEEVFSKILNSGLPVNPAPYKILGAAYRKMGLDLRASMLCYQWREIEKLL